MGRKIVEVLFITINVGVMLYFAYSFLFGGAESSKLEDLCITLFTAILTLVFMAYILLDMEEKR